MRRAESWILVTAALGLAAGCTTESRCAPGAAECAGVCADLRNDEANCGACGAGCGDRSSCVAGACVPSARPDLPELPDAGPEVREPEADAGVLPPVPVPDAGEPVVLEPDAGEPPPEPDPGAGEDAGSGEPPAPGWVTVHAEDFESVDLGSPGWQPDTLPDDGPFSDDGLFFEARGVVPPEAFRISQPFGDAAWLTLESYTRDRAAPFSRFASVVADPADPANSALRIASAAHTDATVVRPSQPLPERYRVSLRVGFPEFGDGRPGLNGYDGGESAEPWSSADATSQNGFYWLAILDAQPRPHNNVWIHHHRKVVVDSDNHHPAWMEVFDGSRFVWSGENPIMMFALDGRGESSLTSGNPFLSYSGGAWQPSGKIRAVDSYLPREWYEVTIERNGTVFTVELSGRFRYGGQRTYRASIDAADRCVWHYNRPSDPPASGCVDDGFFPALGAEHPQWPAGTIWQDWFMFGDPHSNYYEGEVLYDDVRLEVWR